MCRCRTLSLLLALVVVVSICGSAGITTASPGNASAGASSVEARDEAARLMDRVSTVTRSRSGAGGGEPAWSLAATGEPLLIRDFEGAPASYLVPVVDRGGKTVSTIGISVLTGKWCWYTSCAQPKFPLVGSAEAT